MCLTSPLRLLKLWPQKKQENISTENFVFRRLKTIPEDKKTHKGGSSRFASNSRTFYPLPYGSPYMGNPNIPFLKHKKGMWISDAAAPALRGRRRSKIIKGSYMRPSKRNTGTPSGFLHAFLPNNGNLFIFSH